MSCKLRIGLTGGVGSGKTEASQQFSRLGVSVIDTDLIARELVEPGQAALSEIVSTFGEQVLDASGKLDRARLRLEGFSDPHQRKKLESILHPRIRERVIQRVREADTPYCVLVIPLLVEAARDYPVDRILVIDAPKELQIERVARRDKLPASNIEAIIAAQTSREQRLELADDVVVNDGSLQDLKGEIAHLHRQYLKLAKQLDRAV